MTLNNSSVVCGLSGGLGNQMFQYAAARALSLRLDVPLTLDLSWFSGQFDRRYTLANFAVVGQTLTGANWAPNFLCSLESRVSRRWMTKRMGVKVVREPHFHFDSEFEAISNPVYLEGYWQSERYFAGVKNQIRTDFKLSNPMTDAVKHIATQIKKTKAISVHVRRGDYIANPVTQAAHGTCTSQWYLATMSNMAVKVGDPTFYVFSDDPDWAKKNLPSTWPIHFVVPTEDSHDSEDIHLMSLCQHHIIANSSFSWWGAWLNQNPDKHVFAPANWFATAANDTRDLLPAGWLAV